jgi:hypothetical protein
MSSCRTRVHNVSDGVSTGKRSTKPFLVTSSILARDDGEGEST